MIHKPTMKIYAEMHRDLTEISLVGYGVACNGLNFPIQVQHLISGLAPRSLVPNTQQSSSEKTWKECQAWVSSVRLGCQMAGRERAPSPKGWRISRVSIYQGGPMQEELAKKSFKYCKVWHVVIKELAMCKWAEGHRWRWSPYYMQMEAGGRWSAAAAGMRKSTRARNLYILGFGKCWLT